MDSALPDIQNLGIEMKVTVNNETGLQESVLSTLICKVGDCGKYIELYSDSPESVHTVVCPIHGKVGSFPTFAVYRETVKILANKILEAKGHDLISDKTKYIAVDGEGDPRSSN